MHQGDKGDNYSVGYKKPPQHTQFKPGQSGNPKGRPKKVPTMNELVQKELLSRIPIATPSGRRLTITKQHAIVKQFANKALKGDPKALKIILDLLNSGKPESGDNVASLIQEFRLANARLEGFGSDEHPAAEVKSKDGSS